MRQVQLLEAVETSEFGNLVDLVFSQVKLDERLHARDIFNNFDLIIR